MLEICLFVMLVGHVQAGGCGPAAGVPQDRDARGGNDMASFFLSPAEAVGEAIVKWGFAWMESRKQALDRLGRMTRLNAGGVMTPGYSVGQCFFESDADLFTCSDALLGRDEGQKRSNSRRWLRRLHV
ncbi:hypothetical protein B0T10DRAFT_270209 [Thelonectria olida]|uniref:Uncharacterized protein n=1 Tax=Thelonectria olida TaxID=1576542 RepID=A0A9P8W8T0_9HYPO|nr:hypothetical protein B0T10DRAFT_270209 [Thelonectria olida]